MIEGPSGQPDEDGPHGGEVKEALLRPESSACDRQDTGRTALGQSRILPLDPPALRLVMVRARGTGVDVKVAAPREQTS